MPQQTVFDLDGRQAVDAENDKLQDEVSGLRTMLKASEKEVDKWEGQVGILKTEKAELEEKWKEMQKALRKCISRYDFRPGDGSCDESDCNAKMVLSFRGDYAEWSDIERICEL